MRFFALLKNDPYFKALLSSHRLVLLAAYALITQALFVLLLPLPTRTVVDVAFGKSPAPSILAGLSTMEILFSLSGLLMILAILGTFSEYCANHLANRVSLSVGLWYQKRIASLSLNARTSEVNRESRVSYLSYLSHDLSNIQDLVVDQLLAFFLAIPTLLFVMGAMLIEAPLLALFLFLVLPACVFFSARLSLNVRSTAKQARHKVRSSHNFMFEALSALRLIKIQGAAPYVNQSLDSQFTQAQKALISVERRQASYLATLGGMRNIIRAFTILLGGYAVYQGSLSLGGLVLFLAYVEATQKPVNLIAKYISKRAKVSIHRQKLEELFVRLENAQEKEDLGLTPTLKIINRLDLKNVSFSYLHESPPLLNEFHATFSSGDIVLLHGPSGSGKSTFCDLLTRLVEPKEGQILWNGHDASKFSLRAYRKLFTVVFQDSLIVYDSVRANLCFGLTEKVEDSLLWKALERANACSFVEVLPNGLDTIIGEGARTLSGGEKRRLSLARAFLTENSNVYIFDEPTAGLDPESAAIVMRSIALLGKNGSMVFLVCHESSHLGAENRTFHFHHGQNPQEEIQKRKEEELSPQAQLLLKSKFKNIPLERIKPEDLDCHEWIEKKASYFPQRKLESKSIASYFENANLVPSSDWPTLSGGAPTWKIRRAVQTNKGRIYELELGEGTLDDFWTTCYKYPNWSAQYGMEATADGLVYVGDANWINWHLEESKGTKYETLIRVQDWHPESNEVSIQNYRIPEWELLEALCNDICLLAANSRLWYHDRFAHLPGFLAAGSSPRIYTNFKNKTRFLLSLKEKMNARGLLVHPEIMELLERRAKELYRAWDYATANITGTLSKEEVANLPVTIKRLRGFHMLGGQAPWSESISRDHRLDDHYIDHSEDYISIENFASGILRTLSETKIDEDTIKKISLMTTSLIERFRFHPLSVEEAIEEAKAIQLG